MRSIYWLRCRWPWRLEWPLTPKTTPNDSSIGSRTFAHLRHKVPTGYNGMPYPKLPFPFDDLHPHLIHSSLDRLHSTSQTASMIQIQPAVFPQFTYRTDKQSERWDRRQTWPFPRYYRLFPKNLKRSRDCDHAHLKDYLSIQRLIFHMANQCIKFEVCSLISRSRDILYGN